MEAQTHTHIHRGKWIQAHRAVTGELLKWRGGGKGARKDALRHTHTAGWIINEGSEKEMRAISRARDWPAFGQILAHKLRDIGFPWQCIAQKTQTFGIFKLSYTDAHWSGQHWAYTFSLTHTDKTE